MQIIICEFNHERQGFWLNPHVIICIVDNQPEIDCKAIFACHADLHVIICTLYVSYDSIIIKHLYISIIVFYHFGTVLSSLGGEEWKFAAAILFCYLFI